jgi:hypothetical protein
VRWKELSELRRRERAAASSITTRDAPTDIVANARVSAPDMFPASRLPRPILPPPPRRSMPTLLRDRVLPTLRRRTCPHSDRHRAPSPSHRPCTISLR